MYLLRYAVARYVDRHDLLGRLPVRRRGYRQDSALPPIFLAA